MNERDLQNSISGSDALSQAALLRAAADGEISSEQERRLELLLEQDPSLGSRIESERLLRQAVGRVYTDGPAAPDALRARIASAMADADLLGSDDDDSVPSRLAPMTRDQSFWTRGATRALAVAAALTLVATVFVVTRGGAESDSTFGNRTRAVQFVASEHERCITDIAVGADKFRVTDPTGINGFASDVIGREVSLADLVSGGAENVSFLDAGKCHVPGGGGSMHLRFDVPGMDECVERVSLFVQTDQGRMQLAEGVSYELDPSKGGEIDLKSPTVYVWSKQGLVYYLVIDNAKACKTIRERLSVPAEVRPLSNAA